MAVAARHLHYQHAVSLDWIYPVPERETGLVQEGRAASQRYFHSCEEAQRRLQTLEEARDGLGQAQEQQRAAQDRAWLQENHPALLAEQDRERARLNRTGRGSGEYIAQQHTLRQVEEHIRTVLAERGEAAAD